MKREIGLTLLQKCADGMMCQTHQDSVKRFISGTLLRYADNISLSRQSTLSYIFFILNFFRAFPLKTINIFLASNVDLVGLIFESNLAVLPAGFLFLCLNQCCSNSYFEQFYFNQSNCVPGRTAFPRTYLELDKSCSKKSG